MPRQYIIVLLIAAGLLDGCSQPPSSTATEQNSTRINCNATRPELCSQDYQPVCAERETDISCIKTPCPATERKTYSNACSACSDPKVLAYSSDRCPKAPPDESE